MQMAAISPARKAAFQILMAVERGRVHSDDLLRGKQVSALSAVDRNLTTTLVLGVLRWQIKLDEQIKGLLAHPNARLDSEVRIALRMGAFQLLHLDRIPARAAIDESVELAKQAGHRFASRMVNAVLRKLAAAPRDESELNNIAELALAQAHPKWISERWVAAYGLQEASEICRHGQTQPELTVRLASPQVENELSDVDVLLKPVGLVSAARIVISGDVTATAAFKEGRVRIQDEGSQLVAEIAAMAGTAENRPPEHILDACAAPGGKTMVLIERNSRARIVACESNEQRWQQLRQRLEGYSDRVEVRLADAAALSEDAAFDLALVDVPCSGTGTFARNPEIRHRLHVEDLSRQAERQRAILNATLHTLRPGGRLIYSTCSLEPEENDEVIDAILAARPKVKRVPLEESLERMAQSGVVTTEGTRRLQKCVTPEGALRLLPSAFRTDGFFIALLEVKG